MIYITDASISLLKYHVTHTVEDCKIKCVTTNSQVNLKDYLLESVAFEGMEIVPVLYIVQYTNKTAIDTLVQSENNTAYITVPNLKAWKKLYKKNNNSKIKFIDLDPKLYEHNLEVLKYIMTPKAYQYFWEFYCIEKFNSSPYRWYNEVKYLTFLYKETEEKFTCEALDLIYNKASNIVDIYLQNILADNSKDLILSMSIKDKFITFIGVRKSLIESKILNLCSDKLFSYMIFREAFETGTIRLDEGVVILDFILKNKENNTSIKQIKNLFGLL